MATAAWGSALASQVRGAAAGARPPAARERDGRNGRRPLLPVGARPRRRSCAAATPPGPRSESYFLRSRRLRRCFSAIMRPLMSRARSLLLLWLVVMAAARSARRGRTRHRLQLHAHRAGADRDLDRVRRRHVPGHGRPDPGGQRARHRQPSGRDADEQRLSTGRTAAARACCRSGRTAGRRRRAPMQFPRIIFQHRPEGYASRTCEDSTRDSYFCLSFTAETHAARSPGRRQLRERVQQRQGPHHEPPTSQRLHRAGDGRRPADLARSRALLGSTSLYPPRRDFISCADAATVNACMGGTSPARTTPTRATYADIARMVMPDIDAVTMATPPADVEQTVMFSVPATWPDGEYVAYLEVNTEGDYNGTFNTTPRYPTPMSRRLGLLGDELRLSVPRPAVGRVQRPVHARAGGEFSTMTPVGFGSVDGTDADPGRAARDGRLDHRRSAGRAGQRRRSPALMAATETSRLELEVRPCLEPDRRPPRRSISRPSRSPTPKHSHEWAHLHFVVPPSSAGGISQYEVRVSAMARSSRATRRRSSRGCRPRRRRRRPRALMIPARRRPATPVDVDFGGLAPGDALLGGRPRRRQLQPARARTPWPR